MKSVAILTGLEAVGDFCLSDRRTHWKTRAIAAVIRASRKAVNSPRSKPFPRIARSGVLAAVSMSLYGHALIAKPLAPQEQSNAPVKNKNGPHVPMADTVTIPDGTQLSLKLRNDFDSTTVKVGDKIDFTTPYPLRIDGTVVVPQDAPASGATTEILPPRRASRDARVYVAISKILLPDGQTATLRAQKSKGRASRNNAKEVGNHPSMWTDPSVNAGAFVPPTILVGAFTEKGRDWVYKAGAWTTVYFNGPLTIERRALSNLEPPPYKGHAQVFVHGPKGKSIDLYMHLAGLQDQAETGPVSLPLRIEFKPGRYTFSAHRKNGQSAELEVEQDHRYWIEYNHGSLAVVDPEPHRYEMEELAVAPWVSYKIATAWFFPHIVRVKP